MASFAHRTTLPASELKLSVEGVGDVRLPVGAAAAKRLVGVSRQAPFGLGERTLVDRSVRDVREIDAARTSIDAARWDAALAPALEAVRDGLGLPAGKLEARLQKLLIYPPGGFFLPHRDSERGDDMIGTLVVTLPSRHRGGTLVVKHAGETRRFAPRDPEKPVLNLVSFYADCAHEVRPVTEGYRVALSYELHFVADAEPVVPPSAPAGRKRPPEDAALEGALRAFFRPRAVAATANGTVAADTTDGAPEKLVYLLDHEYTPSSLAWKRLKGADRLWARTLLRVATVLDLDVHLALLTVHEIWSAEETGGNSWRYGRRAWSRYHDDDEEDDESVDAEYELQELVDDSATLDDWRDPVRGRVELPTLGTAEDEMCWIEPVDVFGPEHEEYEGWTGNAGNTLERQYLRATVVAWPRASRYRILAGVRSAAVLGELRRDIDALGRDGLRDAVRSILGTPAVKDIGSAAALDDALAVCEALEDAALERALLDGMRLGALDAAHVPAMIALGERDGAELCRALTARWLGAAPDASAREWEREGARRGADTELLAWLPALPGFCREVRARPGAEAAWGDAPRNLLGRAHELVLRSHASIRGFSSPTSRRNATDDQVRHLVALLEAAETLDDDAASKAVFDTLHEHLEGYESGVPVGVLEHFAGRAGPLGRAFARRLRLLRRAAIGAVRDSTRRAERPRGDWSIMTSLGCGCADCSALARFLASPDAIALDLPLATGRRAHLHRQIDDRELPVSHETLRRGSPYKLQLRKREALFETARERVCHEARMLERLEALEAGRW